MSVTRTVTSRSRTRTRRSALTALAFLAPAVVGVVLLRLWPAVEALVGSFTSRSGDVSFGTFERLFSDPTFIGSLKVTLLFSVVINPLQIALALLLAVLLTQTVPLVGLWRTFILLPVAVPQIVSAIIWGVLFRPDGPFNSVLVALGLPAVPWLTSPDMALWSIVIICSWVGVGYWMTFLVAGIKDIPETLYEAAQLDGAGPWRRFTNITLPGLRRPLLFVLVADTVANFLVFAPVRQLTRGGPEGSTNLIMNTIFERAYQIGDLPAASAATTILVLIVVVVVGIQFRLLPGKD
ncbi:MULTISPECIES: carbohydrate ABC transporter permease [unclassified Microbacterium]|uniref:carbohydrate ABC transporter permease n=1 Tax=unclassified Microbacterium TaxID=2609290 RepID=UPI000A8859E3|nr:MULTISPECIES: sugar ABC transporter permease [unclassified Microbacterium]|tara:strand:+ start:1453 stop:2334 length:882 start_codon:yes stop_codon:yes gene_type:complete